MNITELRYLVAIMKWGSVSAAAKQLYAAQPNVSKALKNLEEEYGLRIFERSSTGMIPTEQGKRFIAQAQRVLQQVRRLWSSLGHVLEPPWWCGQAAPICRRPGAWLVQVLGPARRPWPGLPRQR